MPDLFIPSVTPELLPVVNESGPPAKADQIREACHAWLLRSPSPDTRSNYERDVRQFMAFAGLAPDQPQELAKVRPADVIGWRDHLMKQGCTNSSVMRKLTVLRSL